MSKLARFRSRHGEPKRNPPLTTDIVHFILPGFAAFAASRVLTRAASMQIAKRYPKAAKHAGAIASIGTFAAAWFGAHRVKYLEKYHGAIVVGSGLAALQSLAQIYVPQLYALLGDPCPAPMRQLATPSRMQQQIAASASTPVTAPIPEGFTQTSDAEWYSYNDAYDAGAYKGKVEVPTSQTNPPPQPDAQDMKISELLDNSDLGLDNSDLGLDNSDLGLS